MLVEDQLVEVKWSPSTKSWYENKGYVFTKFGDSFFVDVNDVTKRFGGKIRVRCDICGIEKKISASTYFINVEKDKDHLYYCHKCSHIKLSKRYRHTEEEVLSIVASKNNNVLLNANEYVNSMTANLRIKCGMCGQIFITSLSSIENANGACLECAQKKTHNSQRLTPDEVEKKINSVNGNILLNKNEYIDYGTRNLKIKCGKCGKIYQKSLANYVTSEDNRCPSCIRHISRGEKIIMDVLDKYEVDYRFQMRFPDCKDIKVLPYDFYLPSYNLCIEFDGQLHYIPKYGDENFIKRKLHDAMKDWYCRWNNINLLRIPYWEGSHIEEILVNQLNLTPHIETQHIKIKYISNKKSA